MKKRYLLPIAALVLAGLLCLVLLTADPLCIGRIESSADDQWYHIHTYMTGEYTVEFPIDQMDQPCVFQWETGRGDFTAEITDASGELLYSSTDGKNGSGTFLASSDLTIQIDAEGHGGIFSLLLRDEPAIQEQEPESEPEPHLLVEGSHSGGQFTQTYQCWKYDGKHLNFYVENLGSGPVLITINGEYDRIIPAGSAGHITAPISATILAQDMTVKCVTASGDDINIYWKVAQR